MCSAERNTGSGLSKLPAGDVQLSQIGRIPPQAEQETYVPSTPPTDHSSDQHLFGIICNVGPKCVDSTSVVTIWTLHDVGLGHEWFQRAENCLQ